MSNPIWLGSGGCPAFKVSAAIKPLTPTLRGWSEVGTQSEPPVYYRKYATSGGWEQREDDDAATPPVHEAYAGSGVGASNNAFDPATGALPFDDNSGAIFDISRSGSGGAPAGGNANINYSRFYLSDGGGASGLNTPTIDDIAPLSGDFVPELFATSKTVLTLSMASDVAGDFSVSAGDFTFELSDPDTAADAIARAIAAYDGSFPPYAIGPFDLSAAFAGGVFSLYENRSTGAFQYFSYQPGTWQLNVANLVPGVKYHVVAVWEGRTAAGDGSGDTSGYGSSWANTDSQSFDFRPTGTTFTTDALDMPFAAGYQKRLKSVSLTPIGG